MPMPRKPDPLKFCEWCGARLVRRCDARGVVIERPGPFGSRRFCSLSCANHRANVSIGRLRALARAATSIDTCETCGATDRLQVHHRDENPANNHEQNLEVLCISCHLREHWSRASYRSRQAERYQPCGTCAAYRRGCRCDLCVDATRAYARARYRERVGR